MKGTRQDSLSALIFCIPWAFLVMYADLLHGNILWIIVMLLCAVLLGLWLRKAAALPLLFLGNGMSLFFSCLLISVFREPGWDTYFKPLGPIGLAAGLQGLCLMLQYVIFLWNKERSLIQNFFMALSMVILSLSIILYGFLCIQAAQIGAIQ